MLIQITIFLELNTYITPKAKKCPSAQKIPLYIQIIFINFTVWQIQKHLQNNRVLINYSGALGT